jgi:hypothetical protein
MWVLEGCGFNGMWFWWDLSLVGCGFWKDVGLEGCGQCGIRVWLDVGFGEMWARRDVSLEGCAFRCGLGLVGCGFGWVLERCGLEGIWVWRDVVLEGFGFGEMLSWRDLGLEGCGFGGCGLDDLDLVGFGLNTGFVVYGLVITQKIELGEWKQYPIDDRFGLIETVSHRGQIWVNGNSIP